MEHPETKQQIRETIWKLMEEKNIARFPRPVHGRIPNFQGATKSATNLCGTKAYQSAHSIFANPDSPQKPVREKVLKDGKNLIMATPGIRKGFLQLDPSRIPRQEFRHASTIKGSFKYGTSVHPSELQIELFLAGSVAVSLNGGRLGKGKGYTDLEFLMLREFGGFDRELVCTTVHEVQLVEDLPMNPSDLPVNLISTPKETLRTHTDITPPAEINWDILPAHRLQKIPLLQELQEKSDQT